MQTHAKLLAIELHLVGQCERRFSILISIFQQLLQMILFQTNCMNTHLQIIEIDVIVTEKLLIFFVHIFQK